MDMKRKPRAAKPTPDDLRQSRRFIDAAKAASVDESGERFDEAFKKIVPEKRGAAD